MEGTNFIAASQQKKTKNHMEVDFKIVAWLWLSPQ
jgi:hypothetical protein